MGTFIAIIGGLIAVYGYGGAFLIDPQSAPQQAVVELRHLHGAIGLLLVGIGYISAVLGRYDGRAVERAKLAVEDQAAE